MNKSTVAKGLWILKEAYPGKFSEVTDSMIEAWCIQLQDIEPADFEYATRYLAATADDFPSLKEVRDTAISRRKPFKSPAEIWEKILEFAKEGREFSGLLDVFHQDPAALAAVRSVDWDRIRYAPPDQLGYLKHDFALSYRAMTERNEHILMELILRAQKNPEIAPPSLADIRKMEAQLFDLFDQLLIEGKRPQDALDIVERQMRRMLEAPARRRMNGPQHIGDIIKLPERKQ